MGVDKGRDWAPEACTLPTEQRPLRVAEFDVLFATVQRSRRPEATCLELAVPRDAEATARGLAERESECGSFFTFEFEHSGADVVMRISVPPDHVEVLDALAATVSGLTTRPAD
jgi:hypothetical protein